MSLSFFYSAYHLADACQFIFLLLSVPRVPFATSTLICWSCQARKGEQSPALLSPTGGILLRTASLLLHLFVLISLYVLSRESAQSGVDVAKRPPHTHRFTAPVYYAHTLSEGSPPGSLSLHTHPATSISSFLVLN